jgi:hypothetical protein
LIFLIYFHLLLTKWLAMYLQQNPQSLLWMQNHSFSTKRFMKILQIWMNRRQKQSPLSQESSTVEPPCHRTRYLCFALARER